MISDLIIKKLCHKKMKIKTIYLFFLQLRVCGDGERPAAPPGGVPVRGAEGVRPAYGAAGRGATTGSRREGRGHRLPLLDAQQAVGEGGHAREGGRREARWVVSVIIAGGPTVKMSGSVGGLCHHRGWSYR